MKSKQHTPADAAAPNMGADERVIKTWQERADSLPISQRTDERPFMRAEIDDLRAALATAPSQPAIQARDATHKHIKSGGMYELLHDGLMESDLQSCAVYRCLKTSQVWVRPAAEFVQKFTQVHIAESNFAAPVAQHNAIDATEMQPGGALYLPLLRIPLAGGGTLDWECRTSGRSGWLLRAGDGRLIRALTVAEVELVDASIAAAQAGAIAGDTCAQMRALCSACGGTGDVHRIDGEWLGQCNCVHAWQLRAERAEADLAQANEWRAAALADSQQSGERWAQRVAELEAQLARRRAPLSPETQQAIAAARAAGQSIAATPAGLVFMNDGAEPCHADLDCPACGGSGHAADTSGGSAP